MPRRILVLNERDPANPLAGGAEVHVFEIFGRLVARGHDVTLLAASFRGGAREERIQGVDVRRLANRYLYYWRVPGTARREIRRRRYDLVVDVLNKLPFFSPWFLDLPCLVIAHHLFGRTAFSQVNAPVAAVTYLSEKLIPIAYSHAPVMAISDSTKRDLVARGIPADHIRVVPPGLDHRAYGVGGGAEPRATTMLWIGRLEHYKRVDVMIDAMIEIRRRVPSARLVVIGEGSARAALEQQARRRGLASVVEFTGYVREDEKIARLRRAAVLVNTSAKEGWGLTVIEANACGTPSVASDVAGLRDAVQDGTTGLLYPYGDARALADAVVRVLTDDRLRERLVTHGLEWAARFSWEHVADEAEAMIEETILDHRRAASAPLPRLT
jgi:glycosyltransferase involved in cell wall biosynthesis